MVDDSGGGKMMVEVPGMWVTRVNARSKVRILVWHSTVQVLMKLSTDIYILHYKRVETLHKSWLSHLYLEMPIGHSLLQVVSILSACRFFSTDGFRGSKLNCSISSSIGLTLGRVHYMPIGRRQHGGATQKHRNNLAF